MKDTYIILNGVLTTLDNTFNPNSWWIRYK